MRPEQGIPSGIFADRTILNRPAGPKVLFEPPLQTAGASAKDESLDTPFSTEEKHRTSLRDKGLTDEQIDQLIYRVGMGLAPTKIAVQVNKTPGAVRVNIHRALKLLDRTDGWVETLESLAVFMFQRERRKQLAVLQIYALGEEIPVKDRSPIKLYRLNMIPEEQVIKQTGTLRSYLLQYWVRVGTRKIPSLTKALLKEIPDTVIRIAYGNRDRYEHHNNRVYYPLADIRLLKIISIANRFKADYDEPEDVVKDSAIYKSITEKDVDLTIIPPEYLPVMRLKAIGLYNAVIAEALKISKDDVRFTVRFAYEFMGKARTRRNPQAEIWNEQKAKQQYSRVKEELGHDLSPSEFYIALQEGKISFTLNAFRWNLGGNNFKKMKEELANL